MLNRACWDSHDWEPRICPDDVLAHVCELLQAWMSAYTSAARPPSPLPPPLPEGFVDDAPDLEHNGIVSDRCGSLPDVYGDTWHRDPEQHRDYVDRWMDAYAWR